MRGTLGEVYVRLLDHFGQPHNWWPIFGDDAAFEMLLGAVLVQRTRWESVEQAILRVQAQGWLSPQALAHADPATLAELLRPVAYYRQKADGLIAVCRYLCARYGGDVRRMLAQPTLAARDELLHLPRIGNETADVILLYAGGHALFVVDAYTRLLLARVQPEPPLAWATARYAVMQAHIQQQLDKPDLPNSQDWATLYGDFHALINEQCVRYCLTRKPRCDGPPARRVYSVQVGRESYLAREDGCPLRAICAYYQHGLHKPHDPH